MTRTTMLVLALVVASCAAAGAANTTVDSDVRLAPTRLFEPMFSNLDGFTSNITQDPGNVCFGAREDLDFFGGETVALNVFWDDVVMDPPGRQTYVVNWAMLPGLLPIVFAPEEFVFDLTGFPPGELVSFCAALGVELPGPRETLAIQWGGRVEDPIWGVPPLQGILGEILLIAEPGVAADR